MRDYPPVDLKKQDDFTYSLANGGSDKESEVDWEVQIPLSREPDSWKASQLACLFMNQESMDSESYFNRDTGSSSECDFEARGVVQENGFWIIWVEDLGS